MTKNSRSALPTFVVAGLLLLIAVTTGLEWVGKPFRLVHLVTIIGMGIATGVVWMQAIFHARQNRDGRPRAPAA